MDSEIGDEKSPADMPFGRGLVERDDLLHHAKQSAAPHATDALVRWP